MKKNTSTNEINIGDYVVCVESSRTSCSAGTLYKVVDSNYYISNDAFGHSQKNTTIDVAEIIHVDDNQGTNAGNIIKSLSVRRFKKCDIHYDIGDKVSFVYLPVLEWGFARFAACCACYTVLSTSTKNIEIEIENVVHSFPKQYFIKCDKDDVSEDITDKVVTSESNEYKFIPESEMEFTVVNGVRGYLFKTNKKA